MRCEQRTWKLILTLCVSLSLVFAFGCSSGQKKSGGDASQASESDQEIASSKNQIRELRIQELDSSTLITIDGTLEPDFTVFKLNDPLRVVVDLANTELGPISGPFQIGNGTLNEVNTTQFDDATSSISRIIIGFDQVVDYEVVPEGSILKVNVQRIGVRPPDAEDIIARGAVRVEDAPEVAMADEQEDEGLEPLDSESGDPMAMEESEPMGLPATEISDVQVQGGGDEPLVVTIVGDGNLGNFQEERVENPARLVLDFPGLQKTFPRNRVKASAPLKGIRFGDHSEKIRLVLDSSDANFLPEYSVEANNNQLMVMFAPSSPVGELEPLADLGEEPVDVPVGEVVKIEGLDFKQLPNYSRVSVKVPETVDYREYPYENGKVLVDLYGVRLPSSLKRGLDTSEFDSAVTFVSPVPQSGQEGVVRLEVSLREEVPLVVQRENGLLNLDFERTRVFVEQQPLAAADTPPGEEPGPLGSDEMQSEPVAMATEQEPISPEEELGLVEKLPEETGSDPLLSQNDQDIFGETLISGSGFDTGGLGNRGGSQLDDFFGGIPMGKIGEGQRFTGRRISLDFKDADITNIFRLIAEVSKLNIVVGDKVNGKVSLRLINVPWDQALAIILQSQKLGIVRYDNILRIAPLKELEQERKDALAAKEAEQELEDLKVLVLPINYTTAGDLKNKVSTLLTKRGRVDVDERTNVLIIEDVQNVLIKARSLIKTLDTQTAQVIIDGRIVTATRNWQRALGIQWGGSYNASAATGNPTGLSFPASVGIGGGSSANGTNIDPVPVFPGFGAPNYAVSLPAIAERGSLGISLGSIAGIGQLDVRLAALEDEDKIRIISSPRVATLDNVKADISQGSQVPFATVSASGTQTQFVDATLTLSVTPHVTNDKRIIMDLNLANNSVGAVTEAGPQIDIAETKTQVLVKDGDTMVIGGIYVLEDNIAKDGLPWLRSVPVLKVFFSNYFRSNNRRELLFFITPRIVTQALASAN